MKLKEKIDIHAHYFPPAYKSFLEKQQITLLDGAPQPDWNLAKQFEYMDRLHISTAILSLSSPHFYINDQQETIQTARLCNEYGSELVLQFPDKFKIMASLPLPFVKESIEEIRYCREHLQTDGFAMLTNYSGVYLGNPKLDPIMKELNKKPTVIVIHPTHPASVPNEVNENIPDALLEYFFDTTRAVVNMIFHGTIKKYSNIKWIIPHGGAFLTIISDRLEVLSKVLKKNDINVLSDLHNLYYDLAGISMPKQFELLLKTTDKSHLLYGSDSPFTPIELCETLAKEMDDKLGLLCDDIYITNIKRLFNF